MGTLIDAPAHGFAISDPVVFTNLDGGEGISPNAGIEEGVLYYVLAAGYTADAFAVSLTDGGTAAVYDYDIVAGDVAAWPTYTEVADGVMDAPPSIARPANVIDFSVNQDDGIIRLLATAEASDPDANPTLRSIEWLLSHELIDPMVPDDPSWVNAEKVTAAYGQETVAFKGLPLTDYFISYRYLDVYGNASPQAFHESLTTPAGADSIAAVDTENLHNGPATVTIDDDGITILDGALTLQDEFGKSVLEASGFKGSWSQFAALGLYNGAFLSGTNGVIGNGRTVALPYWTVSNQVGSPVLTLLAAPERLEFTFAALNNKKRIASDPIPVANGRLYYVAVDRRVWWNAGTITMTVSIQQYDRAGTPGTLIPLNLIDPNDGTSSGVWADQFIGAYDETGITAGTDYAGQYSDDVGYLAVVIDIEETGTHHASNRVLIDSVSLVPYADVMYQIYSDNVLTPHLTADLISPLDGVTEITVSGADFVAPNLISQGTLELPAGGYVVLGKSPVVTNFTSSGTWTKPAGIHHILVEVLGSGGGGGGTATCAAGESAGAAGGGAGAYARKMFTAADLASLSSATVTVGAAGLAATAGNNTGGTGGTVSFAGTGITTVQCTGGVGGAGSPATTGNSRVQGGVGGTATGGDTNFGGSDGGGGNVVTGVPIYTGDGAASVFGGAARSGAAASAGGSFGAGGSGASQGSTGAARTGAAGSKGIVIVTEFYAP